VTDRPSRDSHPTPADEPAGVVMSAAAARRLAEIACVGVMVLWAGNFVVVKTTIPILTPVGYAFLRFGLAGIVLLVACLWREGSVRLARAEIPRLAALGALGFCLYQTLWSTALQSTSVGNSALLIAATPIFTVIVAVAVGTDTLTTAKLVGALVAFAGVGIVTASDGFVLGPGLAGDALTLVAAFSWAVYSSLGARVMRTRSPLRATAWTVTFGSLFLAPLGLWQLAHADLSMVGPTHVAALLYSALLSSAVGNAVIFWGISLLGPTRITNLQFLPPAIAIVLAALFLGDPILVSQILGGVVIVAGVLIGRRAPFRQAVGAAQARP
jgi:drug/metabolite transporter (DMT)-like permease